MCRKKSVEIPSIKFYINPFLDFELLHADRQTDMEQLREHLLQLLVLNVLKINLLYEKLAHEIKY